MHFVKEERGKPTLDTFSLNAKPTRALFPSLKRLLMSAKSILHIVWRTKNGALLQIYYSNHVYVLLYNQNAFLYWT
jgi:hypothetical protein